MTFVFLVALLLVQDPANWTTVKKSQHQPTTKALSPIAPTQHQSSYRPERTIELDPQAATSVQSDETDDGTESSQDDSGGIEWFTTGALVVFTAALAAVAVLQLRLNRRIFGVALFS